MEVDRARPHGRLHCSHPAAPAGCWAPRHMGAALAAKPQQLRVEQGRQPSHVCLSQQQTARRRPWQNCFSCTKSGVALPCKALHCLKKCQPGAAPSSFELYYNEAENPISFFLARYPSSLLEGFNCQLPNKVPLQVSMNIHYSF